MGKKNSFEKSVDNLTKIVNNNLDYYPKNKKKMIGPDYGHKT